MQLVYAILIASCLLLARPPEWLAPCHDLCCPDVFFVTWCWELWA